MFRQLLGYLHSKFMGKIGLKAPGNYSAPFWFTDLFDLLIGESQNPHFYLFGTFDRVPDPKNQLFYRWRRQDTPQRMNTNLTTSLYKRVCLRISTFWKSENVVYV